MDNGLNRDEVKALKLAIWALDEVRRRKYMFNASADEEDFEFAKKAAIRNMELMMAIITIKKLLERAGG